MMSVNFSEINNTKKGKVLGFFADEELQERIAKALEIDKKRLSSFVRDAVEKELKKKGL